MQQMQQLCRDAAAAGAGGAEAGAAAAGTGGGEAGAGAGAGAGTAAAGPEAGAETAEEREQQGEGSLPATAMSLLVMMTNLVQTSAAVRGALLGRQVVVLESCTWLAQGRTNAIGMETAGEAGNH